MGLYAVCFVLLGMMVFSNLLGPMTALLTKIRTRAVERAQERELLQQFVVQHALSLELGNKILTLFRRQNRVRGRNRVLEQHIPLLKTLPKKLSIQMHCEIYSPVLALHPFFDRL